MDNIIVLTSFLIAVVLVVRYATKKAKRSPTGGVVLVTGPGQPLPKRATLGTIIAVNLICLVGFIIALVCGLKIDEPLFRLVCCMGTLIFAPWVALKLLEAQDPGNRFSLLGSLAAFCIIFWAFGSMWYLGDAMAYVRGLGHD